MNTLRHVWQMIRHNRLFSGIYIFGTALALASVTVFAVLFWVKIAPVYPEYQRDRTCYFISVTCKFTEGNGYCQGFTSYDAVRNHFYKLKTAEKVSATYSGWGSYLLQPSIEAPDQEITVKPTDTNFFDIYSLRFLAGKPFSIQEFESGLPVAVITDRTARMAFGAEDYDKLIGRDISISYKNYRVAGIVRQGTPSEQNSFANAYIPYTTVEDHEDADQSVPFIGSYLVTILTDDEEATRKEILDIFDRFNNSQTEYIVESTVPLASHLVYAMGGAWDADFSLSSVFSGLLGTLLVLLIVPAMNLSGMIAGRMENRLAEMGVRKSFGATRGTLLRQVLWENLILTLFGGILGFIFAYILLKIGIADMLDKQSAYGTSFEVTGEMMFAPAIFALVFTVCCLLNVISAYIPAYRSLRRPIVQSLKEN